MAENQSTLEKKSSKKVVITHEDYEEYLLQQKQEFLLGPESKSRKKNDVSIKDFDILEELPSGGFTKVFLTIHKCPTDKKPYVVKVIDKNGIVKNEQTQRILLEKRILQSTNFPFVMFMEYYFCDYTYVYFVLPYMAGGDLFTLLRENKIFNEQDSKFYAAQVCLAIEFLHCLNIVHRDIKPENILIDNEGYIKLCDFGYSKILDGRTSSFCGTPEYMAPEIILLKGYSHYVDWWSFGILIYELNCGKTPFFDDNQEKIYEKVTVGTYSTPSHFTENLADIVKKLLHPDLSQRYGKLQKGVEDIKNHNWFKEVHWLGLFNQKISAPYKPKPVKNITEMDPNAEHPAYPVPIFAEDVFAAEFKDF